MISDRARMDAYTQALRQWIRPGSVVLDLGTGTGILAMLACQCGAGKVYAVDCSDAVQIAIDGARENGLSNRVVVIQRRSTEVTLPEPVDTIVSDLRGVLPQFQRSLPDLIDARDRFLARGGRLIPRSDSLWISVAELTDRHEKLLAPWLSAPLGLNLEAGARYVANSWLKVHAQANQLLAPPSMWGEIDYSSITSPNAQGSGELRIFRDGVAHGLAVWFDAELAEGIGFSNAPGGPELIYGQAFFPWPEAAPVRQGDVVAYRIRADLVGSDYVWTWSSEVHRGSSQGSVDAQFRQSTFLAAPLTKETLERRSPAHAPGLGEEGQAVRSALELMGSGSSLDEVARELQKGYPARFRSWQEALDFASDLSSRYGR